MRKPLSGNAAAAEAVKLARVQTVFAYPITPSTSLTEKLSEMAAKKEIPALFTQMESEFSTMSGCIGSALAGARTFTATSSQGLLYMTEVMFTAARKRLPVVMINVNRTLGPPWGLYDDWTDSLSLKDSGWLQYYAASPQEALDFLLLGYRIAENKYVKLPLMVCYSGFYVSHTTELVEIPSQEDIDGFLPANSPLAALNPEMPVSLGGLIMPDEYMEFIKNMDIGMKQVPEIEKEAAADFGRLTGRNYEPVFVYNPKRSKTLIVTLGSVANTVRYCIDKRNADFGLVKINRFRPFPAQETKKALETAEKITVFDRDFGAGGATTPGIIAQQIRETLCAKNVLSVIAGINGRDINDQSVIDALKTEKTESGNAETVWLDLKEASAEENNKIPDFSGEKNPLVEGHGACGGCGLILPLKISLETMGKNTVIIHPASCASVVTWNKMATSYTIPKDTVNFAAAPGVASGVKKGLAALGKKDAKVVVFGGDGATYDIGLAALSGAAERNEDIIYICYDNEAYMNTGSQRSSSTPLNSRTATTVLGEKGLKKDIVSIMAAHKIPYLATASLFKNGNFDGLADLRRKVAEAKNTEGFSFLLVYAPCPTGWKTNPNAGALLSELAVETGIWPLVEIRSGKKWILNYVPRRMNVREYLKPQGRFGSLLKDEKLVNALEKEIEDKWLELKTKANS